MASVCCFPEVVYSAVSFYTLQYFIHFSRLDLFTLKRSSEISHDVIFSILMLLPLSCVQMLPPASCSHTSSYSERYSCHIVRL